MTGASSRRGVAVAALILSGLLFWKLRVLDSGIDPNLTSYGGDLYLQHWPMTEYGFGVLRSGHLPLWNPYQLCGLPFLPIPYVGLFYPLNVVYLLFSTPVAIELDTVIHLVVGLLGMWALLRHYGCSHLATVTAALTFVWSGWVVHNVNQPSLFAALSWMPLTVLAVDAVACGSRLGWLGLSLTVALPLLRGGAEIVTHSLLAAAIFGAARLASVVRTDGAGAVARRASLMAIAIAAGAGLAAIQLVPTLELTGTSTRNAGIPYEVARIGSLALADLVRGALDGQTMDPGVTVGLLPLLALILTPGGRRERLPWLCALVLLALSLALVQGGWGFRLYHSLPVIGGLFRRPHKFLDLYSLALAMLAGLAVGRLEEWSRRAPQEIRRQVSWFALLGAGVALLGLWSWPSALAPVSLGLLLLLMLGLGIIPSLKVRFGLVAAMCLVQAASLFASVGNTQMRPLRRPDTFSSFTAPLRPLRERPPYERTHLIGEIGMPVGWNQKLGMLNRFGSMGDFEALLPSRYGDVFNRITVSWSMVEVFVGLYGLGPNSSWRLLDLTGTRFFAILRDGWTDHRLASIFPPEMPQPRLVDDGPVRVYERAGALPRASFVGRARVVRRRSGLMPMLESADFDPRVEVLLEELQTTPQAPKGILPTAAVVIVEYEPERVVIDVSSDQPGYLVLTDLFYPGWRAFSGAEELPIYRADYLFRAVALPAGEHEVRFEYHADTFVRGLLITVFTAVLLLGAAVFRRGWR